MDLAILQKSLDLDTLSSWANIQTAAGKAALAEKTAKWTTDPATLRAKSYEFATLQRTLQQSQLQQTLAAEFKTLAALEPDLQTLCEPTSELEQEAYKELLFLPDWAKPLNFIPFLLIIWAIVRIYIFPGMSLLMPIAMMALPFFLLRFLFGIPITTGRYFHILNGLFTGNLTAAFIPPPAAADAAAASAPTPLSFIPKIDIGSITKMGFLGFTVVQSFLQPYWTYKHLSAIDGFLQKKATTLQEYIRLYDNIKESLKSAGYTFSPNPFNPNTDDSRQIVAYAHLSPALLKLSLQRIGALEALVSLASQPDLCPVSWQAAVDASPTIILHNAYDYRVDRADRKTYTVELGPTNPHALLTGPNRGGKSTTLRGIVASLLLGHTYGAAMATSARLTPFRSLRVCLTPEDLPGSKSRFEREIEFTASTLHEKGSVLVLIDELYHSTNPPDAERACRVYTSQLWQRPNTLSVISTHLFDFVKNAPSSVHRICCPATLDEKGVVHYSYQLSPGICTVSSVDELLVENGLLEPVAAAPSSDAEISSVAPESNGVPE